MGDFLLVHDESGRGYYERVIFLTILLCVIGVFSVISLRVNIVAAIVIALLGSVVLVLFAGYFIYKNPPQEASEVETRELS